MISPDDAYKLIMDNLLQLGEEFVLLPESNGRLLAEDITSPEDSPLFNNSAMDGFAVKWGDMIYVSEENPVKLNIIGESKAGVTFDDEFFSGSAIKISTGAKLPDCYDTIIPIEQTEVIGDTVVILGAKKKGQHVRYKGEEFKTGTQLVEKGSKLTPPLIALLGSVGITKLRCKSKPKVSIITTGTELIPYNKIPQNAEIRDSNSLMLKELVKQSQAEIMSITHVGDSLDETVSLINKLKSDSDVLIFSGGVSVGLHDHVKNASKINGLVEIFWKINQKPGKPMYFAKDSSTLLFGLPGNPVSALMNFTKYVYPALLHLQGFKYSNKIITAYASSEINNKSNRTQLYRVNLIGGNNAYKFDVSSKQGSHMLTSVSKSDGFISLAGESKIEVGQQYEVILFPWKY